MLFKFFNLKNGLFCVSKTKVGEVDIVVTRNVGKPNETKECRTEPLYETKLNKLGAFLEKTNEKISSINRTYSININKEV